ncbi:MAG: histidine phosphatase family protein [Saprospiraceae bacterium]|nr:histidine phosphatase family protein [Saprospiraceae bacterium]
MRTLYLIRHAKSSWDNPGLRDFNRPLNERGQRDAPLMAALIAKMGIKPDLIVSSPARRAITTAQYFADALGIADDDIVRNQEIYEAYPQEILRLISELPEKSETVFMFGHNPTFTDVANRFSDDFIENIPTCGIVRIESPADSWRSFYEGNARVIAQYFPKAVL